MNPAVVDPDYAGGIKWLIWPGNIVGSPRKRVHCWGGGTSGLPYADWLDACLSQLVLTAPPGDVTVTPFLQPDVLSFLTTVILS